MRLNQFYLLNALKRYGSISRASRELMISQPSISRAIQELESELECDLLVRSPKGVTFTPQGEKILALSEEIMAATEKIKFISSQASDTVTGKVKIGCSPFFCSSFILDVVFAMREKYPGIDLCAQVGDGIGVVKSLLANELDLGIILINAYDKAGFFHEFQKNKMDYTKLFDDEFIFFAKSDHPLCLKPQVSMKELVNYPYITYKEQFSELTYNLFSRYGYRHKIISINDFETIKRYISLTEAFSVMPQRVFDDYIKDDQQFERIAVQDFQWKCAAFLICNKDVLSEAMSIFLEELKLKLKE